MRNIILLIVFFSSLLLGAQHRIVPKKLPPGMVWVDDYQMAMDDMEITLGEWFGFLYYLYEEGESWEILQEMVPSVYPDKYGPLLESYKKAMEEPENSYIVVSYPSKLPFPWNERPSQEVSALLMYPVVGLSYKDVEEYISWREVHVNEHKSLKKFEGWLTVQLIDREIWDQLSKEAGVKSAESIDKGLTFPDTVNTHGCYLMNIRYNEICESIEEMEANWGKGPVPVSMFFPDLFGIYNLFGNVAEMTSQRGIATGGSYFHWGKDSFSGSVQKYDGPEKWLGFRCIYILE